MLSDTEIAQQVQPRPIGQIADQLGIDKENLLPYGRELVCIAKAPGSLSDDPNLLGRPRDFNITVRGIQINSGAGFLVVLTGDILRMPGLPKHPNAEHLHLQEDGSILGLN